jgi:hypothetical protein
LSEGALTLPLILSLIGNGLTGVSIAVAISGFVARGAAQWLYGCRMLRVSLSAYARQVFVPVTLAAAPAVLVLYGGVAALHPQTFGSIFVLGLLYSILFAAILAWAVLGYTRLRAMIGAPAAER